MCRNLGPVHPAAVRGVTTPPLVVLPVGASRKIVVKGGPLPWVGKPSFFYRDVEAEEDAVVRAEMVGGVEPPFSAAEVTCLQLGETRVMISVGNKPSSTNT